MARLVNITLTFFYRLIFYNLTILINLVMQNLIPKFRQSYVISKKLGHFSKKFKTLTSSNYHMYICICVYSTCTCTSFLFKNVYKTVFMIRFIFFRSWVINKNVKIWFMWVYTNQVFFSFWKITQDLNKIKKNPEHTFVDIGKCKK